METTNKWVLVLLVLLPTYLVRFSVWGVPLNLYDLFAVGGFAYCVIHYHGWKLHRGFSWSALSLLLIGIIAVLVSDHKADALGIYKSYLVVPIMIGVMIQTARPKWQAVVQALGCSLLFVSGVAVFQWLSGYGVPAPWQVGGVDVRMTSIYDYPNAVGLLAAPIVALSLAWLIHERSNRLFHAVVAVFGCLAIGLSQSDGAVLAVGVAIGISLLFTRYRTWVVAAGVGLTMIVLVVPAARQKVLLQDTSGEVRQALWQGTVHLLKARPLQGAGLANFPDVYAQYKLDRHVELLLYPHNLFLDFWVEFGLLGAIWITIVLLRFMWNALHNTKHAHSLVLLTGMMAMVAYGLVDVPYFKNDLAVLFWVFLAFSDVLFKANPTTHVRH